VARVREREAGWCILFLRGWHTPLPDEGRGQVYGLFLRGLIEFDEDADVGVADQSDAIAAPKLRQRGIPSGGGDGRDGAGTQIGEGAASAAH
jgi:hypothetical protein